MRPVGLDPPQVHKQIRFPDLVEHHPDLAERAAEGLEDLARANDPLLARVARIAALRLTPADRAAPGDRNRHSKTSNDS